MRKTILIVDNDECYGAHLSSLLRRHSFQAQHLRLLPVERLDQRRDSVIELPDREAWYDNLGYEYLP